METALQATTSAPTDGDGEDMPDPKFNVRAVRRDGELVVDISVSRTERTDEGLVVDEEASDQQYLDGRVLALRVDFDGKRSETRSPRVSKRHPVKDGGTFEYVAIMHGQPWKLAAVTCVEDE